LLEPEQGYTLLQVFFLDFKKQIYLFLLEIKYEKDPSMNISMDTKIWDITSKKKKIPFVFDEYDQMRT